jgi:hypothetical protein
MYTYSTAILALFTHSQGIQVMMAVVPFPREGGMRGPQGAGLALACLLEHLRVLVQVVQLEVEASQLPRERKISMQPKMMMILLRECQTSMLAQCILLIGEELERQILIGLRNGLALMGTGHSGPTLKRAYGMISTTPESV